MIGRKFGKLTVIREDGRLNRHRAFLCECECGNRKRIQLNNLKSGGAKTCGCSYFKARGLWNSRIQRIWQSMMQRCYQQNNDSYRYYGARGIKVCDRWQTFLNFYDDMHQTYFDGAQIERVDSNGNYDPSNCKWATADEQAQNRRGVIMINLDGKTQSLAAWARERGVKIATAHWRMKQGWSIERVLTPAKPIHRA